MNLSHSFNSNPILSLDAKEGRLQMNTNCLDSELQSNASTRCPDILPSKPTGSRSTPYQYKPSRPPTLSCPKEENKTIESATEGPQTLLVRSDSSNQISAAYLLASLGISQAESRPPPFPSHNTLSNLAHLPALDFDDLVLDCPSKYFPQDTKSWYPINVYGDEVHCDGSLPEDAESTASCLSATTIDDSLVDHVSARHITWDRLPEENCVDPSLLSGDICSTNSALENICLRAISTSEHLSEAASTSHSQSFDLLCFPSSSSYGYSHATDSDSPCSLPNEPLMVPLYPKGSLKRDRRSQSKSLLPNRRHRSRSDFRLPNAHLGIASAEVVSRFSQYMSRNRDSVPDKDWMLAFAGRLSVDGLLLKDYRCYIEGCNQKKRRKDHIVTHLYTHVNYKPFSCPYCCARFLRRNECNRHEISHSRIRPYVCDTCGTDFNRKDLLLRHAQRCYKKVSGRPRSR